MSAPIDFSSISAGSIVSLSVGGGLTLRSVLVMHYVANTGVPTPGELHLADGRVIYFDNSLCGLLIWQAESSIL